MKKQAQENRRKRREGSAREEEQTGEGKRESQGARGRWSPCWPSPVRQARVNELNISIFASLFVWPPSLALRRWRGTIRVITGVPGEQ